MVISSLGKLATAIGGAIVSDVAIGAAKNIAKKVATDAASEVATKYAAKLAEDSVVSVVNRVKHAMTSSITEGGSDLISYSQPARLEPILLLDHRATYVPFVRDVIHTMSSLFTAYFLQSIALDTSISGVKVLKRLDKFNPDRNLAVATRSMLAAGIESYHYGLPFPGESVGMEAYGVSMEATTPPSYGDRLRTAMQNAKIKQEVDRTFNDFNDRLKRQLEEADIRRRVEETNQARDRDNRYERAMDDAAIRKAVDDVYNTFDTKLASAREKELLRQEIEKEFNTYDQRRDRMIEDAKMRKEVDEAVSDRKTYLDGSKDGNSYSVDAKDINKLVTDISNLAVGKMIELTINENGQSAKIPVSVRLRVTGMPSNVLVETLSVGGFDGSFKNRWRQWRAGEIRFWADGVFAMDRIEAHRKASIADKSGYYNAVYKRAGKNALAAGMSGDLSVGTASSIIVMTEATKKELESKLNRRLSDYRTRQSVFEMTYSMLMVVIDPEWETVVIYHRGIEMPTELTAKDVASAAKGNGPDVGDLLKMFMEGKAPNRF